MSRVRVFIRSGNDALMMIMIHDLQIHRNEGGRYGRQLVRSWSNLRKFFIILKR